MSTFPLAIPSLKQRLRKALYRFAVAGVLNADAEPIVNFLGLYLEAIGSKRILYFDGFAFVISKAAIMLSLRVFHGIMDSCESVVLPFLSSGSLIPAMREPFGPDTG